MSDSLWKKIPDFPDYEVSYFGEIRKVQKNGYRMLKPYEEKSEGGSRQLVIHLRKDGSRKKIIFSKAIYSAFVGIIPKGYCVVHANGDIRDNIVTNLVLTSNREMGKKTAAKSRRKPVIKMTPDMKPVEAYTSAREAARKNFMSYQVVMDRCNGKTRSKVAPDGFIYRWDNDSFYEEAA